MKRTNPVWISEIDPQPAKDGPLQGLTFAIKDNIDYADVPTTCACPESAYTPDKHAEVVARLLEAGAVAVGKTNMDQFATGLVGTRTPYGACSSVFNPEYISGGSSSGSAVAVASGQVDFALGTDTAGSGRVPAAFNGIYGLKPTFGAIPTEGVVPACKTLDCVSIFARTIHIARRVYEVFNAPVLPSCLKRRLAYVDFVGDPLNAPLYEAAVARAKAHGWETVKIDYEPFRETAALLYSGPWVAERYAAVGQWLDHMQPVVKQIIGEGTKYSAVDAFNAQYRLEDLRERTRGTWADVDALVLPTAGWIYKIAEVEANPIELNTNLGYYTNFVNLLNLSALAIPAGMRADGLPFGVTLVGDYSEEESLLEIAAMLETVEVAVVGAHLTGQSLNRQLTDRGARLVKTTRTARDYRLFALANTTPPKPGLVREPGFEGPGIEVEVWSLPAAELGSFVAMIPPPLGIGTVALADGTTAKGFICEPAGLAGAAEITSHGGWRDYLASKA
jgi:allophanate hydrolase